MTKLTPEQVAEMLPNALAKFQACVMFYGKGLGREYIPGGTIEVSDIAALLADRASLVAELKAREQEAMDFAKYVIDDLQRTGSVGPLAVLYAAFRTSGN